MKMSVSKEGRNSTSTVSDSGTMSARWRNLIVGSTSYLGLCLVCTFGTPVAGMQAQAAIHHPHSVLITMIKLET
jgi:hypothetical protein